MDQVQIDVPAAMGDGTVANAIGGKFGDQLVSGFNGKYANLAARGMLFSASNVAAQALSVALTTTYTGLAVGNPLGNTKNLVLVAGQYALSVAPVAIASLHIIAGYSATTNLTAGTPLAAPGPVSLLLGTGPSCTARAKSATTIVNPQYLIGLGSGFTAGALYGTTPSLIDFGGCLVVPPGGWFAWGALTAVTGFGTLIWAEVPI